LKEGERGEKDTSGVKGRPSVPEKEKKKPALAYNQI